MTMFTLVQLEYITALDTYRHFATAAEKCFVTQPTLSMQIKKMEDYLGVMIFDRSKQPVVPTDIGSIIINQAREILKESQKIPQMISLFQNEIEGELKIGIIPTLAPYLLPFFISDFRKKYPKVQIKIKELLTDEIVKNLEKDILDVGVLVTPLHNEHILERTLFYEEIKVYTHIDHPLASEEKISVDKISSPEIWLLKEGHCFHNQVINICDFQEKNGQHLPFDYQSNSLETLKKLVDLEGGFTLLPELAAQDLPVEHQNQLKQIADFAPLREVSLVYARNFVKPILIEKLYQNIVDKIPNNMKNQERGKVVEWK